MQNYFALAAPEIKNAQIDTTPIGNALDDYRLRQRQMQQDQLAAEDRQYQRGRNAQQDALAAEQRQYERARTAKADQRQLIQDYGKGAASISLLPKEAQPAAWQRLIQKYKTDFPNETLDPEDLDFRTGPSRLAAMTGQVIDTMDRQLKQAQINKYEAEALKDRQAVSAAQAKSNMIKSFMPNADPSSMPSADGTQTTANAPVASQNTNKNRSTNPVDNMTNDEKSRAALALANDDLKSYSEIVDAVNQRMKTSRGVQNTLKNLYNLGNRFSGETFENALGPFQGPESDSWISQYITSPVARGSGEIVDRVNNFLSSKYDPNTKQTVPYSYDAQNPDKRANLTELRSEITKGVNTLASIIKPLVRLKGDQWTDTDTKQLNAALGDLLSSKNVGEYRRRLKTTAQNLRDSYGIDIEQFLDEKPANEMSTPSLRREINNITSID